MSNPSKPTNIYLLRPEVDQAAALMAEGHREWKASRSAADRDQRRIQNGVVTGRFSRE